MAEKPVETGLAWGDRAAALLELAHSAPPGLRPLLQQAGLQLQASERERRQVAAIAGDALRELVAVTQCSGIYYAHPSAPDALLACPVCVLEERKPPMLLLATDRAHRPCCRIHGEFRLTGAQGAERFVLACPKCAEYQQAAEDLRAAQAASKHVSEGVEPATSANLSEQGREVLATDGMATSIAAMIEAGNPGPDWQR